MRDKIVNVALIVLTTSSVILTSLVVRNQFFARHTEQAAAAQITVDPNWREYDKGGIALGPAKAPVTVAIFSDFQCPFCKRLSPVIDSIQKLYPSEVRVVFHHYPLDGIHPYARTAALAAQCGSAKGVFHEMEEALFDHQEQIGMVDWSWFGQKAGIKDSAWLAQCMADQGTIRQVNADIDMGAKIPLNGTPTVFVNANRLPGTPTYQVLTKLIASEIKGGSS